MFPVYDIFFKKITLHNSKGLSELKDRSVRVPQSVMTLTLLKSTDELFSGIVFNLGLSDAFSWLH